MAGFDAVTTQDSITTYLKTIFTNTPIYEDGLPDDAEPAVGTDMQLTPYIVLAYGPMRPTGGATGRGFGGARWDDYFATLDVDVYAPTGRMCRLMLQSVLDTLVGWVPTDSSPISIEGNIRNFVYSETATLPTTFQCSARLRYALNTTGIGQPIPH